MIWTGYKMKNRPTVDENGSRYLLVSLELYMRRRLTDLTLYVLGRARPSYTLLDGRGEVNMTRYICFLHRAYLNHKDDPNLLKDYSEATPCKNVYRVFRSSTSGRTL